jgi:hypothetical protein
MDTFVIPKWRLGFLVYYFCFELLFLTFWRRLLESVFALDISNIIHVFIIFLAVLNLGLPKIRTSHSLEKLIRTEGLIAQLFRQSLTFLYTECDKKLFAFELRIT